MGKQEDSRGIRRKSRRSITRGAYNSRFNAQFEGVEAFEYACRDSLAALVGESVKYTVMEGVHYKAEAGWPGLAGSFPFPNSPCSLGNFI